ncbi:porin [Citrobacter portucalensis]|uniref:porin n=1 Tax=Citrobacter portucalensis TaxID=1639133 RepID=UPI00226B9992|nr:porin [Citrobacter portucalensis]MCX9024064.1 porin [Citrobacter portucalensis]MCX9061477.1 porin [Citrobacter portucalensis]
MNKAKLLAAVVPIVLFMDLAQAAEIYNRNGTKVDLYGGINSRREFNSDGNYDKSLVDLGFYGETKVTSDITGYGFWQYRITEGSNEWSSYGGVRQQFAGLKMVNVGSLDYGRNYGVLYDIERYTDVAPYFSGDTWTNAADNFMVSRGSSMLTYRNESFFGKVKGLDFGLQYQAKKEGYDADKENGEGYGYSLSYNIAQNLRMTGAYSNSRRTQQQNTLEPEGGKHAEAWGIGGVYTTNHLYLASLYSETRNMTPINQSWIKYDTADKTQNVEFVAQYQFDNGLRPSVSYVKSRVKDHLVGSYDLAEYIQAGVLYKINANVQLWFDHRFSLASENDELVNYRAIDDDRSAAGVIFMF